jgi:hypothetical protein
METVAGIYGADCCIAHRVNCVGIADCVGTTADVRNWCSMYATSRICFLAEMVQRVCSRSPHSAVPCKLSVGCQAVQ